MTRANECHGIVFWISLASLLPSSMTQKCNNISCDCSQSSKNASDDSSNRWAVALKFNLNIDC